MLNELMDLKNDLVFQKIFGSQKNKKITAHLLSLILKKEVKDLNLDVNKDLLGEKLDEKKGILDVRATLADGEDVDIEIQVEKFDHMIDRMMYYWARMHSEKIKRGSNYQGVTPSIVILIANYRLDELEKKTEYHTKWGLKEIKDQKIDKNEEEILLTKNQEYHILELPKLKGVDVNKDELALWLKFVSYSNSREVMKEMENGKNEYLEQAIEELKYLSNEPGFQRMVESREMFLRDQAQKELDSEKRGREEGKLEGKLEGKTEGKKEEKIEIAKKMLERKISIDEISIITGLSREEVEKLK